MHEDDALTPKVNLHKSSPSNLNVLEQIRQANEGYQSNLHSKQRPSASMTPKQMDGDLQDFFHEPVEDNEHEDEDELQAERREYISGEYQTA